MRAPAATVTRPQRSLPWPTPIASEGQGSSLPPVLALPRTSPILRDAVEQLGWRHAKGSCQLDDRGEARITLRTLQSADLARVQLALEAKCFLSELHAFAFGAEIGCELIARLHAPMLAGSGQKSRAKTSNNLVGCCAGVSSATERSPMRRISPSTVIASLALFFALGGSAIAAKHYLITSAAQIKPSVLRELRGKSGSAGSQGVSGIAGPQGPQGAAGAQGSNGPQGPAGPVNLAALTTVSSGHESIGGSGVGSAVATCPSGSRAVSGAINYFTNGTDGVASRASADRSSWFVVVANGTGAINEIEYVEAIVYCSTSGSAVAARTTKSGHLRAESEAKAIASSFARNR
jgi:Collagen triple helix repeat (20 copies)